MTASILPDSIRRSSFFFPPTIAAAFVCPKYSPDITRMMLSRRISAVLSISIVVLTLLLHRKIISLGSGYCHRFLFDIGFRGPFVSVRTFHSQIGTINRAAD
uniref:Uncharacterized protein n=1 Tax=Siphoviridae sp. ctbrg2 TaxID=2823589 RepID=A0A8S5LFQ2_9CAUD|nr:MAG TPA: hypothetical protein [Siphoviridae sp. ctbrg2]